MTRVAARGRGLATELLRHAVHLTDRPIVIHAQVRLERWYAALGFRTVSEMFLEHGMPHYAMRREPAETR
jgi:predicted GNAT family N-acyltransferase